MSAGLKAASKEICIEDPDRSMLIEYKGVSANLRHVIDLALSPDHSLISNYARVLLKNYLWFVSEGGKYGRIVYKSDDLERTFVLQGDEFVW